MDYTIAYTEDGEPTEIKTNFLVVDPVTQVYHGELQSAVIGLLPNLGAWHFTAAKYPTILIGTRRIEGSEADALNNHPEDGKIIIKDEILQVQRQVSSVVLELLRFQTIQKLIENEVKK